MLIVVALALRLYEQVIYLISEDLRTMTNLTRSDNQSYNTDKINYEGHFKNMFGQIAK